MAFFNSSSPVYKKVASRDSTPYTPAGSNGLASMFGSLLGGITPVYKTRDGHAAREPSSSGLLRIFIGAPPSYKTLQPMIRELVDEDLGEAVDSVDAVQAEDEDADDACPPPIDTVVLL